MTLTLARRVPGKWLKTLRLLLAVDRLPFVTGCVLVTGSCRTAEARGMRT